MPPEPGGCWERRSVEARCRACDRIETFNIVEARGGFLLPGEQLSVEGWRCYAGAAGPIGWHCPACTRKRDGALAEDAP